MSAPTSPILTMDAKDEMLEDTGFDRKISDPNSRYGSGRAFIRYDRDFSMGGTTCASSDAQTGVMVRVETQTMIES